MPISILTRGMLLGDEDVINGYKYSKSVVVRSQFAKCLVIDAVNFIQRILIFQHTKNFIQEKANEKNQKVESLKYHTLAMIEKEEGRDKDTVTFYDVFNQMYCNKKIPKFKFDRLCSRQIEKRDPNRMPREKEGVFSMENMGHFVRSPQEANKHSLQQKQIQQQQGKKSSCNEVTRSINAPTIEIDFKTNRTRLVSNNFNSSVMPISSNKSKQRQLLSQNSP